MNFFPRLFKSKKNNRYILTIITALACMFLTFVILEQFNDHSVFGMDKMLIILNVAVISAIFAIFYIIFFNVKNSCVATMLFVWFFGTINHYVYLFRDKPILAVDVFSANTAMDVASNYSFAPDTAIIKATVLFFIAIFIVNKLPLEKKLFPAGRIIHTIAMVIFIMAFYSFFFISNKTEKWNLRVEFTAQDSFLIYGTALSEMLSVKQIFVVEPEGYSVEKVNEIIEEYRKNPYSVDQTNNQQPDIFVIIDEAFADYSMIMDLPLNEDPMPKLHSLDKNTISGTLYTSIWGGNTANTEFEFLTGDTLAFQPVNSVTFQGLVNEVPSVAKTLKENGYGRICATHPAQSSNWSRNTAYSRLGFEEFLDEESYTNPYMIRKFISDKSVFDKLIEQYNSALNESDSPVFLYTMTIQNHGGYVVDNTVNVRDEIKGIKAPFDSDEEIIYFNLIKETDEAFADFIEYLQQQKRPAMVVFLGDHQPGLTDEVYASATNKDDPLLKYQVPFYIWTNYDIESSDDEMMSANYLAAYMLSKTSVNMTDYQTYLLKIKEDIPVITAVGYMGKDGNYYKIDDTASPYHEMIEEYRMLQYYNIYDANAKNNDFFY